MTSLRDLMGIFQSFKGVWEKLRHFFGGLHIVLSAFIAHTVLVCQLLPCLQAEKHVVGIRVVRESIVHVVGRHQLYPRLIMHPHQLLVDSLLLGDSVILHLQEKVSLPENILITQRSFFGLLVHSSGEETGHFACQTGA